jgi:predicted porin
MKKAALIVGLAAAAAAVAAPAAQAQTAVQIYGIVDAAIVGEHGGNASPSTKITSGAASASRIGFKGTEDLGNGLSAFFTLETGVKIDTGEVDAAGTIFNRQAFVGLKSRAGEVALGRQYTPWHTTLVAIDPFSTGYAGTSKNLFPDNGTNVRTSNTVTYKSPKVNGFDGELAYSVGEQSTSSTGRQFGGAAGYTTGPLALRVAYNNKNTDVLATATAAAISRTLGRNTLFTAAWQLPMATLRVAYGIDKGFNSATLGNNNNPYGGVKPTPSTDGRDILLGLTAPVGPGTLMFSAMHKDDRTSFNQDASSWGVGYLYSLSKRTGLYAAYAHINNQNGAGYTVANNTESGTGNSGYNLGMRHVF